MRSRTATSTAPIPTLRQAVAYFVRLMRLVRPYWGGLGRGLGLGLVIGLLGLVSPYIAKLYFDSVYPARDFSLLHVLVIAAGVLALATAFMSGLRSYYMQVVNARLTSSVGLMYFNHLQHLPVRFFDEHRVGEVISRLGDVRGSLGTITRVFQTLLVNGVYLVVVPPFLLLLSVRLTLIALLTTPLIIIISTASSRVVRRFMKQNAEAAAELGAIQYEVLSQIRTFKAMGSESAIFADVREQTQDVLRAQLKASGIGTMVGFVNALVGATGAAIYTWYAWTLILRGDLTLGGFVAFGAYLGYLTGPVGQVASLFADFQQTAVTLGRAFEYLDVPAEQDPTLAYRPPLPVSHIIRGEIRLTDVDFGYVPDRRILHGISVSFLPGTITALVGASGAGKSSILRLLCRMADASGGSIRIDGQPIAQIPLQDLRRQVGVVWQEPTLFRGTIRENLTFGLEHVAQADIDEILSACQLEELIGTLPEGYETPVAEWGATLSGGQRQRFAIARALLRDTAVLLLDEATSQVDVRTEEAILRVLLKRVRDKTVVFATHRLATASLADQICVLGGGRVVGLGTHAQLANDGGIYAQMLQTHQTDEQRRVRMVGVT